MTIGSGVFGWLRVKVCIFPYTLKVVLTTLTLPCECDLLIMVAIVEYQTPTGIEPTVVDDDDDDDESLNTFLLTTFVDLLLDINGYKQYCYFRLTWWIVNFVIC